MIDFYSFQQAVERLQEALKEPKTIHTRNSAILSFVFTYELAVKFLKRCLKEDQATEAETAIYSIKELFRLGREHHLINEIEPWFRYLEARNKVVHTYDEERAESIYQELPNFLRDCQSLLKNMQMRPREY